MKQEKRKQPKPDFKKLDSTVLFNYKEDLLKAVEKHGFTYVSQYVHDRYYRKEQSIAGIAKSLPRTASVINAWMHRWRFPTRPRGGNTKNKSLQDKKIIRKIMESKGHFSVEETAKACGCSPTSVHKIWKKRKELFNV